MSDIYDGLDKDEIERFMIDTIIEIKNLIGKPDEIWQRCEGCGQVVAAPFSPVKECPICTPEKFKNNLEKSKKGLVRDSLP